MKREELSLEEIHKAVCEGTYATQTAFNTKKQNLLALITYIEMLEPSLENIQRGFKLIKFYRLPLVIAFRYLYEKIAQLSTEQVNSLEDALKEIASYMASMIQSVEIKVFDEIKFIFRWGRNKKKFKFNIAEPEVQFSKFLYGLSLQKKDLISELSQGNQERVSNLIGLLDDLSLGRFPTVFEDYSINFLKESAIKQVEKLQQQIALRQSVGLRQPIDLPKKSTEQSQSSPIKKQKKKNHKKAELQEEECSHQQVKPQQRFKKIQKQKIQNEKRQRMMHENLQQLNYQSEKKLPMCCRRYFVHQQVIEQPENLKIEYKYYNYPFRDRPDQKPSKQQKIKRTLCGFLNTEGGIVFFGIKQNSITKKREVEGLIISEKVKLDFRNTIFTLLKDVLPDAHLRCNVKWVPIKSNRNNQFMHGRYIAKVIIEKGAKDQLYSYKHDRIQKFAFKTENQFLVINQAQKILKMFHDKLRYPQKIVYQLHSHPCYEPLAGKPVYSDKQPQYLTEDHFDEFPSVMESRYQDQYRRSGPKPKYQEKPTQYLLIDISKQKLKEEFQQVPDKLGSMVQIESNIILAKIHKAQLAEYLKAKGITVIPVYTRVKCTLDQSIVNQIVAQIEKNQGISIKERSNGVLSFMSSQSAVIFWLKVREMDTSALFTPEP